MAKLPRSFYLNLSKENIQDTLQRALKTLENVVSFGRTMTNDLKLGHTNIENWKATGTTPGAANTEFAISHNLPYIPIMFIYYLDRQGDLYKSTTAWTAATNSAQGNIYLKCTVVSAVYAIIIF